MRARVRGDAGEGVVVDGGTRTVGRGAGAGNAGGLVGAGVLLGATVTMGGGAAAGFGISRRGLPEVAAMMIVASVRTTVPAKTIFVSFEAFRKLRSRR